MNNYFHTGIAISTLVVYSFMFTYMYKQNEIIHKTIEKINVHLETTNKQFNHELKNIEIKINEHYIK